MDRGFRLLDDDNRPLRDAWQLLPEWESRIPNAWVFIYSRCSAKGGVWGSRLQWFRGSCAGGTGGGQRPTDAWAPVVRSAGNSYCCMAHGQTVRWRLTPTSRDHPTVQSRLRKPVPPPVLAAPGLRPCVCACQRDPGFWTAAAGQHRGVGAAAGSILQEQRAAGRRRLARWAVSWDGMGGLGHPPAGFQCTLGPVGGAGVRGGVRRGVDRLACKESGPDPAGARRCAPPPFPRFRAELLSNTDALEASVLQYVVDPLLEAATKGEPQWPGAVAAGAGAGTWTGSRGAALAAAGVAATAALTAVILWRWRRHAA